VGFHNNLLFFPLFVAAAFPVLKLIPLARKTKVLNFTRIGAIVCYFASAVQVISYIAVIYRPELFFTFHIFILVLAAGASSFSLAALVERSLIDNDLKNLLQNTSRLTSLGGMAAEISHEIRNPVTVLALNNSQLLSRLDSQNHVDVEYFRNKLEVADVMLNRLTDIMQTLRDHYNNGVIDNFKNEKVKKLFEEVRMVSELKAKRFKIDVLFKCEDESLSVDCRSVQIIQAVQNLIQNSMDELTDVHEPLITVEAQKLQEDLIKISVTDNGRGVPNEIKPYIFDSFFTTKSSDKGSGLGLSISKRLIEDHGGTLYLEETLPTTFVIILPVRRANANLFIPEKRLVHGP
jgi:signal transduction histidine kinase